MHQWLSELDEQKSGKELKKAFYKKEAVKLLYVKGVRANSYMAKKLGVSIPTIQTLLNELIEEEIITDFGPGESNGGRRPNMYGLAADSFYTLGIDIGRYSSKFAVYDHKNENISGLQDLQIELTEDIAFVDKIYAYASKVIADTGIAYKKLIGIGINMPGLIDSARGINHNYLNFEKPIQKIFEEKFQKRVFLENDARARALAELKFGKAIGKKNVLVLLLEWGVGMGMILNGQLYKGNSGFSGEFSHIPIQEGGALCHCGKHGCLETIASGMALVKKVEEGLMAGQASILKSADDTYKFQLEEIIEAVKKGDLFTTSLMSNMAHHLGKGIGTLIQVLNPELVIIGGKLSKAGEYITTPIKQSLFMHCLPKLREDVALEISELDIEAGVLGAIAGVTNNLFQTSSPVK
ncbi:ROK family transcriptional regulator [Flammeovirgaceae bacterium SG7u.111]|nr:ROK family transcriptional regulator [Flammeovirgaceae bacterium SG7u.132]WPO35720.1 ROK family transcriptional regulator [Flammeovirgaceae bacterium SG7u.111]